MTFSDKIKFLSLSDTCSSDCSTALAVLRSGVLVLGGFSFFSISYSSTDCLKYFDGSSTCIQCSSCLFFLSVGRFPGLCVSASALLFFLPL